MIVNPGIRRFLGSAIQRLFNSASVSLPLTHTAVPTRGSITPTFTRATTETGQKWDEAGYLDFTALAGEMVFKGARRVRNLLTFTEDFSNAAWTKLNNGTGVLPVVTPNYAEAPDGTTTACRVQLSAGGGTTLSDYSIVRQTSADQGTLRSVYVKSLTSSVDVDLRFRTAGNRFTVTTEWTRVAGALYTLDGIFDIAIDGSYSASADILIWHPQLEDVTGQTTQTASEYVSVGVESAPAYHGSMVDGVKCFPTDRSGNPISTSGSYPIVGYVPWGARTNLCLQSNAFTTTWLTTGTPAATQNAIGPDGATSAWTLTDNAAGALEVVFMPAASLILTAETWTASVFVGKTSGAQASYPVVSLDSSGVIAICTIDTSNGVATAWTAYTALTIATGLTARCRSFNDDFWRVEISFTATAAGWTFALYPAGTTNATQSTGVVAAAAVGSAVFYGAQVELGSFATPYIPTTTVAVARNSSVLTYTGADVADIKTLACTFSRGVGVSNNGYGFALGDGTVSNYSAITFPSGTESRFLGVAGGATQWSVQPSYTAGTITKQSVSIATNDIKMDKDGVAQTQDTSATLPTINQLAIGHITGSFQLNGPVGGIYGWTRNLSQSELGAVDR